jgi:hypothetical protein
MEQQRAMGSELMILFRGVARYRAASRVYLLRPVLSAATSLHYIFALVICSAGPFLQLRTRWQLSIHPSSYICIPIRLKCGKSEQNGGTYHYYWRFSSKVCTALSFHHLHLHHEFIFRK